MPGPNQLGYDAYMKGKPLSANPHVRGTLAHRMWRDGWQDAEDEVDEAEVKQQEQEKATKKSFW